VPGPDELVFVYGTLKRGGEYHRIMADAGARLIGTGKLLQRYPLLLARYPCLIDKPGSGYQVSGEIYSIPDASSWRSLDWLEGHPDENLRRIEPVQVNGETHQAWTYFFLDPDSLPQGLSPVEEFPIPSEQG
jgi:gamma-glutamylcyclotransferase (GGCT)/AIG2-like uncharacterized protein YtfP